MGELLLVDKLEDIEGIVAELRDYGAISFPILKEEARLRLVEEALRCPFRVVDREAGGVIQEAEACQEFGSESLFIVLMNELQEALKKSFAWYNPYPFKTKLLLNTIYLLRYCKGSIGITPHIDSPAYINLMLGVNLTEGGCFCICEDEHKKNPKELKTTPGNVILMRAPGFLPNDGKQFHYLDGVCKERYSLWIRQSKWG